MAACLSAAIPPSSPAGYENCDDLDVSRPDSCVSTCSSATSTRTLNREEMSFMSGADLDELCRQIFQFCDTNGDGYITHEEILAQCEDDPQLIDSVMESMDSDGDGRVSFEDFRSGLKTVKKMLQCPQPTAHSTPGNKLLPHTGLEENQIRKCYSAELIYESEVSLLSEQDQKWEDTIGRIDPQGHISKNKELKKVWLELFSQNSTLLPKFEEFLLEVVDELEQSRSDCQQIHEKMKRVLRDHNKEASEMDSLLHAQLEQAYNQQERKSDEKSHRLSVHFQDMLMMKEEQIAELLAKEEELQKTLENKLKAERNLREERKHLIKVNNELQKQLADYSNSKLRRVATLSLPDTLDVSGSDEHSLVSPEVSMLSPGATPLSPKFSSSPDIFSTLEPPSPATRVSPHFSLAAEVEQALGNPLIAPSTQLPHHTLALSCPPIKKPGSSSTHTTSVPSITIISKTPPTLTSSMSPPIVTSSTPPTITSTPSTVTSPAKTEDTKDNKPEKEKASSARETHTVQVTFSPDSPVEMSSVVEDDPPTSLVSLAPPSSNTSNPPLSPFSMSSSPHPPTAAQPSLNPDVLALDCPSITISTLITRREDLPRPPHSMPNRVFKVVFLGDPGVGKTSIIHRLSVGEFESFHSTIGLDFSTALLVVREERVVFQLWDTAGQERFHSTTAVYLRRADAFIVVYDVTNPLSFKGVKSWISLIKGTLRSKLPVLMLMGNKCDQCTERRVSREEGQKLALDLQALFSETSALSGDNVLQSHTTLASLLLEREDQDMEAIRQLSLKIPKQTSKKCRC